MASLPLKLNLEPAVSLISFHKVIEDDGVLVLKEERVLFLASSHKVILVGLGGVQPLKVIVLLMHLY